MGGQRSARLVSLGAVVLAHLVMLAVWWRAAPSTRREPAPRATPLTIQVVALPPLPIPSSRASPPQAARKPPGRTTPPQMPSLPSPAAASIDSANPMALSSASPASAASPGVPPAEPASAPARLDLALPAWHRRAASTPSPVERALDDARSNSAHLTPEQRMNRRFDSAEHVDTLADGSVRVRRGDSCTLIKPSRAMQLDPTEPTRHRTAGQGACP